MLKEFYDVIRADITKAAGVRHEEIDPTKTYAYRDQAGEVKTLKQRPKYRDHKAADIATVCAFAKRFAKGELTPDAMGDGDLGDACPVIWFSRSSVVAIIDDQGNRVDRMTLPLAFSPQVRELADLETRKLSFTQQQLIFKLRTMFRHNLAPAGDIIKVLRQVKFDVGQDGNSSVGHGKTSIGKSMRAEVTGVGEIPEYVTLNVPIFERSFVFNANVELALEPDPATQQFQFFPLAGVLERAIGDAERALGQAILAELGDVEIPTYYGQP